MNPLLKRINRFLAKYSYKLIKEIKSETNSKTEYEVLLPSIDCDYDNNYEKALCFALKNPEVKNIALTGPYGSGKSSFLKKFKHSNPTWNYLEISLATFTDIQNKKKSNISGEKTKNGEQQLTEEDQEIRNQNIERSILQQIFYREKASKIPFSRFKRIINLNRLSLFLHSLGIAYMFTYSIYMLWPDKINQLLFFDKLGFNTFIDQYYYLFTFSVATLFLYYFFIVSRYLAKLKISKFSPKDLSIDLNEKNIDKASIFNEHIDEIIYFFQVTNYEIVIIEDLDRHEDTDIFIKLRELNGLINSSKDIKRKNGGVRFIYAVRDDMFVNNERTKFFDFIIPIIPYINPNNSYEKLKEKFSEDLNKSLPKALSEDFLNDISLFIDDMRLLLNIYNEYKLYKSKIDENGNLNKKKLLAIIAYKNFCPIEFSKLHNNTSIINTILNQKKKYMSDEIDQLININNALDNKIENIEHENIKNLQELKMVYMYKIVELTGGIKFTVSGVNGRQPLSFFMQEDNFDKLIGQSISGFYDNYREGDTTFEVVETSVNKEMSYKQRKELINNRTDKAISKLRNEIELNKEEINRYKTLTLSEIMQTTDIFKYHKQIKIDTKESKLLKYLLSEGYIDEDFHYYISFFHEGDIALTDLQFVLSVKNKEPFADLGFELKEIDGVLKKLNPRNFETIAIFNFSLLNYLLETKTQPYFNYLLAKINDRSEKSIEFAIKYIEAANKESRSRFLLYLCDGFFEHIFSEAKFSDERKLKFFIYLIELDTLTNIKRFNINDTVSNYISNISTLPKLSSEENNTFRELINSLKIKFKLITDFSQNKPLFEYIYENNNYLINVSNLKKIFEYYNGDLESFKIANYTTITSSDFKYLKIYIESHLEEYVKNVVLEMPDNCDESEESIIRLLNSDKLYNKTKLQIIGKIETKISDINSIKFDPEIWKELFLYNKVIPFWENIMHYFHSFDELDEAFWSFLNSSDNYKELCQHKLDDYDLYGEDFNDDISTTLLFSKELNDEAYDAIIKSFIWWKYPTVSLEGLSELKVDRLLLNRKIFLTNHNIEEVNKYYPHLLPKLIDAFKTEFMGGFNELPLTGNNFAKILKHCNLKEDEKRQVIQNMNQELIVGNVNLAKIITEILSNVETSIEFKLFNKLMAEIEGAEAVKLLVRQEPSLANEDIEMYLLEIGGVYAETLDRTAKHLKLRNNPNNYKLLKKLEKRGLISSVNSKPTPSGDIIVHRRRK